VRGHPRTQPDAKHFRHFPSLAKNVVDFAFGKARLAAISECHPSMAAVDPFRPSCRTFILRRGGCCELCQRLAVVPRHPRCRVRGEFSGMPLQLREIVEGIGSVQLTGMDQTHEQIARLGSIQRSIEQRLALTYLPCNDFIDLCPPRSALAAAQASPILGTSPGNSTGAPNGQTARPNLDLEQAW
jgi:hypothetical protein